MIILLSGRQLECENVILEHVKQSKQDESANMVIQYMCVQPSQKTKYSLQVYNGIEIMCALELLHIGCIYTSN